MYSYLKISLLQEQFLDFSAFKQGQTQLFVLYLEDSHLILEKSYSKGFPAPGMFLLFQIKFINHFISRNL